MKQVNLVHCPGLSSTDERESVSTINVIVTVRSDVLEHHVHMRAHTHTHTHTHIHTHTHTHREQPLLVHSVTSSPLGLRKGLSPAKASSRS